MPGSVMAMARVNRPSIMVYGGTIRPGNLNGQKLDIVSAFESYGKYLSEEIGKGEMDHVLRHACPGAGACGGMYTANTMASAIEDRKSTRLNSSHVAISYAVFCLKKKRN